MDYKIDINRTKFEFRRQLESFMNSFIMTCSPYNTSIETLKQEATARSSNSSLGWIENAGSFCSYRTVDKIIDVRDDNCRPYLDIRLSPSVGIMTSNWFIWPSTPCFEAVENGVKALQPYYGRPTYTIFLDIEGSTSQLQYLRDNVGAEILVCYWFPAENDFHRQRHCFRFAKTNYLRESILLTQGFVLDYLDKHPLNCFNGPFIEGEGLNVYALEGKIKLAILNPILSEYKPRLRERKAWVDEDYGLKSESL